MHSGTGDNVTVWLKARDNTECRLQGTAEFLWEQGA